MASVDLLLSVTVAKNVAKTIQLFAVKSEQLVRKLITDVLSIFISTVSVTSPCNKFEISLCDLLPMFIHAWPQTCTSALSSQHIGCNCWQINVGVPFTHKYMYSNWL